MNTDKKVFLKQQQSAFICVHPCECFLRAHTVRVRGKTARLTRPYGFAGVMGPMYFLATTRWSHQTLLVPFSGTDM